MAKHEQIFVVVVIVAATYAVIPLCGLHCRPQNPHSNFTFLLSYKLFIINNINIKIISCHIFDLPDQEANKCEFKEQPSCSPRLLLI